MQITSIKTYPVRVPLLCEFKAAYGVRNTADFVIVEIIADDCISGWGEASTIPIYDEGSSSDVVFIIRRYFTPLLIGQDPTNISYLMSKLDHSVKGSRYAKCAIDFALHDLSGKIYNVPVYKLLGGGLNNLRVCWVISSKSKKDIKSEVVEKIKEGYRDFKLKVGIDTNKDIENLSTLRELVGPEVSIRIDGNEAWNPKQAISIIEKFIKYDPEHIEQPVPAWDLEGLKFVRTHTKVPIVADECVLTSKDSINIAAAKIADRINIKVSRDGGIVSSRKIVAIAEAAGQKPFAGSNLELGVGTIASAHFFSALPEVTLSTELIGPLLFKEDILKSPIVYNDGSIFINNKPGLGVEPDKYLLEKYKDKEVDLL